MRNREISNSDDIIDSRDVIARIEALHEIATDETADSDERTHANNELGVLQALAEQGEGLADWEHGEALIRDSYFEDYARELAEDIGAVSKDQSWPNYCIDWERAARDLKMDYTSLEFDGVTYWARS